MKKIIITIFAVLIIIPSVAYASWWNPFTWFKKSPEKTIVAKKVEVVNQIATSSASSTSVTNKAFGKVGFGETSSKSGSYGSFIYVTFLDSTGKSVSVNLFDFKDSNLKEGESVIIYYNPKNTEDITLYSLQNVLLYKNNLNFNDKKVATTTPVQTTTIIDNNTSSKNRLTGINTRLSEIDKEYIKLANEIGNTKTSIRNEGTSTLQSMDKLSAERRSLEKDYVQLEADKTITESNGISDEKIKKVFDKYCNITPVINYTNTDYSVSFSGSLGGLAFNELVDKLINGKYLDNQIPEALYYVGFKLLQANNIDDSFTFYRCAAEKYYDMQAMYRLASVYEHGTDSIKEQLPKAVIKKNIAPDYKQSYYWISSLILIGTVEKTILLDTSTQRGWNSIAILDTLQNTGKLTKKEMIEIEGRAREFVYKRYPAISRNDGSLYSHSMGAIEEGLSKLKVDSGVSNVVLDSQLYTDTKNGFSIIPPRGYKKDTSRGDSLVAFSNSNGVMDINVDPVSDDLGTYVDSYVSVFMKGYPDFNLISKKETTLSGKSAYKISGTFTFDSNKFVLTAFAVKSNKNYFIEVQSSGSTWGTDEDNINSSLLSFKMLNY